MEHHHTADEHATHGSEHGSHPYRALLLSVVLSFAAMYAIMFSMVDRASHVYLNLSNVYMTGLMAASMVPIMLVTMSGMFRNKKLNILVWAASALALGMFWTLLRTETGVGNRQFLRAMISHHSAAIQMCNESSLTDPQVRELCNGIISSQEREIAEMKALLGR